MSRLLFAPIRFLAVSALLACQLIESTTAASVINVEFDGGNATCPNNPTGRRIRGELQDSGTGWIVTFTLGVERMVKILSSIEEKELSIELLGTNGGFAFTLQERSFFEGVADAIAKKTPYNLNRTEILDTQMMQAARILSEWPSTVPVNYTLNATQEESLKGNPTLVNVSGLRPLTENDDTGGRRLQADTRSLTYYGLCVDMEPTLEVWLSFNNSHVKLSMDPPCEGGTSGMWQFTNAWSCSKPTANSSFSRAYGNCFGRCGEGCGLTKQFTLDCAVYDFCLRFGGGEGSCNEEFIRTIEDRMWSDNCGQTEPLDTGMLVCGEEPDPHTPDPPTPQPLPPLPPPTPEPATPVPSVPQSPAPSASSQPSSGPSDFPSFSPSSRNPTLFPSTMPSAIPTGKDPRGRCPEICVALEKCSAVDNLTAVGYAAACEKECNLTEPILFDKLRCLDSALFNESCNEQAINNCSFPKEYVPVVREDFVGPNTGFIPLDVLGCDQQGCPDGGLLLEDVNNAIPIAIGYLGEYYPSYRQYVAVLPANGSAYELAMELNTTHSLFAGQNFTVDAQGKYVINSFACHSMNDTCPGVVTGIPMEAILGADVTSSPTAPSPTTPSPAPVLSPTADPTTECPKYRGGMCGVISIAHSLLDKGIVCATDDNIVDESGEYWNHNFLKKIYSESGDDDDCRDLDIGQLKKAHLARYSDRVGTTLTSGDKTRLDWDQNQNSGKPLLTWFRDLRDFVHFKNDDCIIFFKPQSGRSGASHYVKVDKVLWNSAEQKCIVHAVDTGTQDPNSDFKKVPLKPQKEVWKIGVPKWDKDATFFEYAEGPNSNFKAYNKAFARAEFVCFGKKWRPIPMPPMCSPFPPH